MFFATVRFTVAKNPDKCPNLRTVGNYMGNCRKKRTSRKKHVLFLLLKHQEPLGIVEGCATAEAQRELQELWGVGGEVQALNRGETQVQTLFQRKTRPRDWGTGSGLVEELVFLRDTNWGLMITIVITNLLNGRIRSSQKGSNRLKCCHPTYECYRFFGSLWQVLQKENVLYLERCITLPKTNIAPEKWYLFQGLCLF